MAAKKKRTDLSKGLGGMSGRAGSKLRSRGRSIDAAIGRATGAKKKKKAKR